MALIDRECVRRLLDASNADATLVFVRGECVVMPDAEIDDAHRGLVVIRQRDLAGLLPGGPPTEERLDVIAHRLDNVVRDLGA
ncbi:hypothetical protein Misp01_46480 [Microtetraspora sp. NBRC 13810]|uniref:hypothetical protein n=1 Tax=Microtetraspora sp. NBRC 13810 TaxID=3030990 RepID=UPI0024A456DC|nr:hypothetical protein [Microtetraspora sp. NBRC 13810]GLW09519.1 hypothetical protein Misp01_46480 [Microtetraspora sp. NBRC 13810]